ncbi:MAG: DMT family transporter [Pseudomonadota bacterium]
MSTTTSPGLINWLTLIGLGLIWGASFMATRVALDGVGPLSIAAIRLTIGASALYLASRALGHRLPAISERKLWLFILAIALLSNALPFTALGLALQHVPSAFAGVCMAAVPLLVLPLAHFLVPGELMTRRKTLGFLIGFCGVVMLIGLGNLTEGDGAIAARLACIGAAFCYAIGSITTRRAPQCHPIPLSAAALIIGTVFMLPTALFVEGWPGPMPTKVWSALIYLGLAPTALATILLVRVIQSAGPSFLSLVNYQVPIWSVVFGAALLGEAVPGQFLTALGLILAGLAVSQARRRRPQHVPSA